MTNKNSHNGYLSYNMPIIKTANTYSYSYLLLAYRFYFIFTLFVFIISKRYVNFITILPIFDFEK